MSKDIIKKLAKEVAAYVAKGANASFRYEAKHHSHTFLVSHTKIKKSIQAALDEALEKKEIVLDDKVKQKLTGLVDTAATTTINNIKVYFNVSSESQDFQITVTKVTGIEELTGGYSVDGYYSKTEETIYDNIRNSFNNLKQKKGFPAAVNAVLKENKIEKTISRLNLVVGHVVSVTERRTRKSASNIKGIIQSTVTYDKDGKVVEGITWADFLNLFSNNDRVLLNKLATGPTKFTWKVRIEDGISNNPNKKLIRTLGITEARLNSTYQKILKKMPDRLKKKLGNSKGSDNLPTVIKKSITKKVKTKLKKDKRIKVDIKDDSKIDYPSGEEVESNTKKYTPKRGANKKTNITPPKFTLTPQKDESAINLNALKAQINAKLSMTVIKNMGTPALENRTGRFAGSAQVTDIIQTPKGFPSIGYTYQKYPYQTFEPGFAQGSTQRDPRVVISKSIREIAKDLIVGRFYTRRT